MLLAVLLAAHGDGSGQAEGSWLVVGWLALLLVVKLPLCVVVKLPLWCLRWLRCGGFTLVTLYAVRCGGTVCLSLAARE